MGRWEKRSRPWPNGEFHDRRARKPRGPPLPPASPQSTAHRPQATPAVSDAGEQPTSSGQVLVDAGIARQKAAGSLPAYGTRTDAGTTRGRNLGMVRSARSKWRQARFDEGPKVAADLCTRGRTRRGPNEARPSSGRLINGGD